MRWWAVRIGLLRQRRGILVKGFGVCVSVESRGWFPSSVSLVPRRGAREWVGSRNAATVTQSSVWLLLCGCKCVCMCFFKAQWAHLFSLPRPSEITHTPLTNNSTLVWVCREACVVTYVWYFARLCCPWRQAVTVQQSVQIGSAPCTSAFSLDAKTLLDSRRDWVWWCRQRANSSSQWDNRLLLLHLCWPPDWAYWKVRCREGQKGEI